MPVLHFLRLNFITLQWALGKVLTAYYFPFVNFSLAGMPKDFILFALCLWGTCSWRDCAPETLRAAEWEPCSVCVLPCGVLVYLPTLLWVFSAQLAANLWITPLLAITTQSPDETRHDDHDNTISCERRERYWKPAHNIPPLFFFFQGASLLIPVRKKGKKINLCINVEGINHST